jgi:hypothetical protein
MLIPHREWQERIADNGLLDCVLVGLVRHDELGKALVLTEISEGEEENLWKKRVEAGEHASENQSCLPFSCTVEVEGAFQNQ